MGVTNGQKRAFDPIEDVLYDEAVKRSEKELIIVFTNAFVKLQEHVSRYRSLTGLLVEKPVQYFNYIT